MALTEAANVPAWVLVGPPVTGLDFFDRDSEMAEFMALLERGAHVSLTAPRRIGKTSLILEAQQRLGLKNPFLFVDLQSCQTETDAVVKLAVAARDHRDLRQKIVDSFRNALSSLSSAIEEVSVDEFTLKIRQGLAADWRTRADDLVDRLADCGSRVVICFDELPVLISVLLRDETGDMTVSTVARARTFMSWLREATIRTRGRVNFVVSGSIGLEPLLSRAGISDTMNTFTALTIGPWERHVALGFVERSATRAGIRIPPAAAEHLLNRLGYLIPHHVAMFVHAVQVDGLRRKSSECDIDDVSRIYEKQMLSPHGHVDLATYEDRLKRVVGPETLGAALELLTEAAVEGRLTAEAAAAIVEAGCPDQESAALRLRFLLGVFEHDGYLRKSGDAYVFVSHLLRDWWNNRFGFGYVRVDRR